MQLLKLLVSCFLWCLVLSGFSPATADTGPELSTLSGEAGFYEIEPVAFSFQGNEAPLHYLSSRTRISYTFYPSDANPEWKPLFVFFNGGPGCATSTGLLSLDTSPVTLDKDRTGGKPIKRNPNSWTALGNLLYIDAPNTGFSYNLVENASDGKQRAAEFEAQNFNPFIDAAQTIRMVLRFLSVHPDLQSNPVVLVGESYGGVRATAMLNLLLFYSKYGDGSKIYRDEALAREIQQHMERVFPKVSARPFPPATIAGQFGRQVLIQPLLAGLYQDRIAGRLYEQQGSPIHKIAAETGKEFTPCAHTALAGKGTRCNPRNNALEFVWNADRDLYHYAKPGRWFESLGNFAGQNLLHVDILARATRWDPLSIPDLRPDARMDAYRYKESRIGDLSALLWSAAHDELPIEERLRAQRELMALEREKEALKEKSASSAPEPGASQGDTLVEVLGPLEPWDDYLVGCNDSMLMTYYRNSAIQGGYRIAPTSLLYGRMFLQNLALIRTFITNAAYDLIIYGPAIPLSLEKYSKIVKDVRAHDDYLKVTYRHRSLQDIPTPESRIIYFPRYEQSGHGVAASQPQKLLEDVRDWMLSWMD